MITAFLILALALLVVLHRQVHGLRRDLRIGLLAIHRKERHMSKELDDLVLVVTNTEGVIESATAALNGYNDRLDALAAQLEAAGIDNTLVVSMAAELKAKTDALAAAVAAVPPTP